MHLMEPKKWPLTFRINGRRSPRHRGGLSNGTDSFRILPYPRQTIESRLSTDWLRLPDDRADREQMEFLGKIAMLFLFDLVLMASAEAGIRSRTYRGLKGFSLSSSRPVEHLLRGGSELECGKVCLEDPWCRVFTYDNSDNRCRLIHGKDDSAQLRRQGQAGFFYAVYEDDTWVLMFTAKSEIGIDIYGAFMGTADLSPWFDCEGTSCDAVFRSPLIDVWDTLPIGEVKFVFYENGKKVLELRFDGRNSTKESWFSKGRLLRSPCTDLGVNTTPNVFSIRGDNRTGEKRYFFINYKFRSCSTDWGWMGIFNREGACSWEKSSGYPLFKFSAAGGRQDWTKGLFREPDQMTISAEFFQ